MDIYDFWEATVTQNEGKMRNFFHRDAIINWHNSNERFTLDEYIKVNCDYPNDWDCNIERVEYVGNLIITATHVFSKDKLFSFHAISFLKLKDDKIILLDEYWGEDEAPPKWRVDMKIGKCIN